MSEAKGTSESRSETHEVDCAQPSSIALGEEASKERNEDDSKEDLNQAQDAPEEKSSRVDFLHVEIDKPRAWQSLVAYLENTLRLDYRSAKAFRVLVAWTLILDLLRKFRFREYFYSNSGMMRPENWDRLYGKKAFYFDGRMSWSNAWDAFVHKNTYYWSFHLGLSDTQITLVIGAQIAFAVLLLFGFQKRLMFLLSGIFLCSLTNRNLLLVYGGAKLSALLCFIGALLPSESNLRKSPRSIVAWMGGLVAVTQIILLLLSAGVHKAGQSHWKSGDAMMNVTQMNLLTKLPAQMVGQWARDSFQPLEWILESFLRLNSWSVPYIEIVLPLCLLLPLRHQRQRLIVAIGGCVLYFGILCSLNVGYFMPYSIALMVLVLPSSFWERLNHWFSTQDTYVKRVPAGILVGCTPLFDSLTLKPSKKADENRGAPRLSLPAPFLKTIHLGLLSIFFCNMLFTGIQDTTILKFTWPHYAWNSMRIINSYQNWGVFKNPNGFTQWYVGKAVLNNGDTVDILNNGRRISYDQQFDPTWLFDHESNWRVAFAKANKLDEDDHRLKQNVSETLREWWNDNHEPERHVRTLKLFRFKGWIEKLRKGEKPVTTLWGHYGLSDEEVSKFKLDRKKKAKRKAKKKKREVKVPSLSSWPRALWNFFKSLFAFQ